MIDSYQFSSVVNEDEEKTKRFLREAINLRECDHPNLMTLRGIAKLDGQYVTIMDHMANKDLKTFVRNAPKEVNYFTVYSDYASFCH